LQKLLAISNTEREEAKAQVLQLQQEVDAAQQAATKEKIKSDNLRDKALKLETKMELLKEDTAADFASRLDAATRGAAKDAAEKAKKQAERQVEAAQAEAQFQAKIAADAQAEVLQLKDELIAAKEGRPPPEVRSDGMLCARHFAEAMKNARRSVSKAELARYNKFRKDLAVAPTKPVDAPTPAAGEEPISAPAGASGGGAERGGEGVEGEDLYA
jgi:transitional endoplasmic reticulum ATPase